MRLGLLSSDPTSELNVLGHDRDSLGMNRTEVGVFEESNEISFGSLLQSQHCSTLESEIILEVLSDLSDESLEGELANQEFSGLLKLSDFS